MAEMIEIEVCYPLPLKQELIQLKLPLGSTCHIFPANGSPVEAEVVGFSGEKLFLMPSDDVFGLAPGARGEAVDLPAQAIRVDFPQYKRRRAIDPVPPPS